MTPNRKDRIFICSMYNTADWIGKEFTHAYKNGTCFNSYYHRYITMPSFIVDAFMYIPAYRKAVAYLLINSYETIK